MKRRLPLFLLYTCISLVVIAGGYSPTSVPNPHNADMRWYVANPDHILSANAVAELNSIAAQTERKTEVEMAIVAIEEMTSPADAMDFAQTLFNYWGIGKKGRNTGVLILLVKQSHDIRIHTGGGIEGILTDAVCADILNNDMIPLLADAQWDAGLLAGARALQERLTTDDALQELLLDYHPADSAGIDLLTGYFCLSFFLLILLAIGAYRQLGSNSLALNNIRYRQAQNNLYIYKICAIFFPLPCALFWWWYKQAIERLRLLPMACPQCHHIMHLLSEQEEDRFLNTAEQAEEQVHSVDYDVWLCPDCKNHLVLPYTAQQTLYSRCPHCHAVTYTLLSDVILQSATQLRNGTGEKTYHCRHCGATDVKLYTLPKLPVVVVTGGNGGHGGGGFSGGSFSGGISFGGGAGGKF
ncbi:MAG: TPM domain-containing protein [Paludibacter sp.]|nr:TPM domain-containing protein [Bacteroidales bacterium]MCM1069637.1 TPM domain-containing protein [Prevotella sp.]MCM1354283.1 TPM domain-containing protein [Bacteroides sp.]MCM1443122.1 TPM domain-containing protein [Muribaculum sp.]MCM1482357.1 TPM domain-containing protein [Paludibacter sp.]